MDTVKKAYGLTSDPTKLERVTPAGTAFQYHLEQYGVWVFFDDRQRVTSLRFDAPFRGKINGIAIGDSVDRLRTAKGPPARQFQGFPVAAGSPGTGLTFATAWVYEPANPSFARYDVFENTVRSIIIYSCSSQV